MSEDSRQFLAARLLPSHVGGKNDHASRHPQRHEVGGDTYI